MTSQAVTDAARRAANASLGSQPDERLTDLARAGNERAFEAIVVRYREPLIRYCRRLLPAAHRHRAEDVVQQVLANAHRALQREDERDLKLRSWLHRIAHNQALNSLRDEDWGHAELTDSFNGVDRPDQAFERRERLAAVLRSVRALPEPQRVALVRRELGGESHEAIAADLGMSHGAVRQLVYRARTSLRSAISIMSPVPVIFRLRWLGGASSKAEATGLAGAGAKPTAALLAAGALGLAGSHAISTTLGDSADKSRVASGKLEKAAPSSAEDFGGPAFHGGRHRGRAGDQASADHGAAADAEDGPAASRGESDSGDYRGEVDDPGDDYGAAAEPMDDQGTGGLQSGADDPPAPTSSPPVAATAGGSDESGGSGDPADADDTPG